MTTSIRKIASIGVLTATAALLSGCSTLGIGGGNSGPSETAYVARDVESLYTAAKERLDRGDLYLAAGLFDEVERQHPYSPWARRAQLMSAFAYYASGEYNAAIQSANRFLSIHPGNRDAPYAYYLIGISYYEQISDVERDQAITRQAQRALNEVVRRYPRSAYADDARLKLDLVNDHLAGKEMEIGRFYERSGNWLAAQLRFQNVIEDYETPQPCARSAVPPDRNEPRAWLADRGAALCGRSRRQLSRQSLVRARLRSDRRIRSGSRPGRLIATANQVA